MPIGLTDKLYWRNHHCLVRAPSRQYRYVSLCGRAEQYVIGGQECRRPPVHERCAICDGLEMKRRGWSESGPASATRKAKP